MQLINWRRQRARQRNWQLLKKYLTLLALSSILSCAHGVRITSCVVDVAHDGFQCVSPVKVPYFKPEKDGQDFRCLSPPALEIFLKACQQKTPISRGVCTFQALLRSMECQTSEGHLLEVPFDLSDNYYCVSHRDYLRILDRCK